MCFKRGKLRACPQVRHAARGAQQGSRRPVARPPLRCTGACPALTLLLRAPARLAIADALQVGGLRCEPAAAVCTSVARAAALQACARPCAVPVTPASWRSAARGELCCPR